MTLRTIESHAACLVAGAAMCFLVMWGVGQGHKAKADLKAAQAVISYDTEADGITARVGENTAKTVTEIRYKNREVVRYVPQVVTPEIVERFPLPVAFVRLHDAAVVSEVPASAWELDGSPSDVGADQALGTIVGNYGTCLEIRAQLVGLQDWIKEQQALSESSMK